MKIKKVLWFSLETDKKFKTEKEAFDSGEDFTEGSYCSKCKCITTTECNCEKGA